MIIIGKTDSDCIKIAEELHKMGKQNIKVVCADDIVEPREDVLNRSNVEFLLRKLESDINRWCMPDYSHIDTRPVPKQKGKNQHKSQSFRGLRK